MVTPAKVVQDLKGVEGKEDILSVIKKHTLKVRRKEEIEVLKPTLANLYGLEIRFKEHDKNAENVQECK